MYDLEPDDNGNVSLAEAKKAIESAGTDTVSWILAWSFTPQGIEPIKAYRRFVALVYVIRPDLLEGRDMRSIAASLAYGKSSFENDVKALRQEIKYEGRLATPSRSRYKR
jgi:hypothetical protein